MRILIAIYGLALLLWVIFQLRSLRDDHFPYGVIAAEALGGAWLVLGLFSRGFDVGPTLTGSIGGACLLLLLVDETALRVIGIRNAKYDVDLSVRENRVIQVVGLVIELALIGPAICL